MLVINNQWLERYYPSTSQTYKSAQSSIIINILVLITLWYIYNQYSTILRISFGKVDNRKICQLRRWMFVYESARYNGVSSSGISGWHWACWAESRGQEICSNVGKIDCNRQLQYTWWHWDESQFDLHNFVLKITIITSESFNFKNLNQFYCLLNL